MSTVCRYGTLRLPRGRPSYRRKPQKKNTQHFKTWSFFYIFAFSLSFFEGPFCALVSGSEFNRSKSMWMRIYNTAFNVNFKSLCHLHLCISPLELSQLGQQLSTAKLPTAVRQELHNSMEEAKSGGRIILFFPGLATKNPPKNPKKSTKKKQSFFYTFLWK